MDDDKIINFPGATRPPPASRPKPAPGASPGAGTAPGTDAISPEQVKAIQLVQSGMSFVCIAIKPTPSGADFFTAVHGDAAELRNAQDHLAGVIDRAFTRKGV
jgi:hypothetical protein